MNYYSYHKITEHALRKFTPKPRKSLKNYSAKFADVLGFVESDSTVAL